MAERLPGLEDVLAHPALAWDDWAISRALAQALWRRLEQLRPARVLELGSGTSTVVLAAYAARHGASLLTLEHDPSAHARTGGLLDALGLRACVALEQVPCVRRRFGPAGAFAAYDRAFTTPFDFVFVDGPPERIGRQAALFTLAEHLAPGWELWMKDGVRPHERDCVQRWQQHFTFAATLTHVDPRGVWVLGAAAPDGPPLPRRAAAPGRGPLVSCLMPTRNRRAFVPQALSYFLAQDYPDRELVVVDDGTDPVADLMPDDPRIRYVPLRHRQTLGAKRNLACREARGDVLVHWDDDDWMAPWRLSYQVHALQEARADVCGLARLLFFDPKHGRAWEYRYGGSRPWVAGGTLCYTRDCWKRQPFGDVNVGEDTRFVWALRGARMAVLDDPDFYVALIHPANSSPKRTHSLYWHPADAARVRALLGDDLAFYEGRSAAPRPARIATALPRVTVSLPFYRCKPYLRRAVESILGQTYANLRLVVVNDGDDDAPWSALDGIDDPRLVRFDLAQNHGRYFADTVVLHATDDAYLLLQDADDWSAPDRLATLMAAMTQEQADAAVSQCRVEPHGDDPGRLTQYPLLKTPPTALFEHRADHFGLFRTELLRRIGGTYNGFRIGYDTLVVNLLAMAGRIAYVEKPLYHYVVRPGSLVRAEETGFGSAAREAVWTQLHQIYDESYALYRQHREGRFPAHALGELIGQVCARRLPPDDRTALAAEAARLRALLEPAPPADRPARAARRGKREHGGEMDRLLQDRRLPWNEWTVSRPLARALAARLAERRPRRVLELGSGTSTAVLARYAADSGAEVVSLEHDPACFAATSALLDALGLRAHAGLTYAPLAPSADRFAALPPEAVWYRAALSGSFDFVFVDGPPERYGRQTALFALAPHLADAWELWMKDAYRPHERTCLDLWARHFAFAERRSDVDPRGLAVLTPALPGARSESPRAAADLPLVSCLMPTHDRRPFVPQAIRYFLEQDYPNRELVVVDDGTDAVADLVPADPRIRYLRLSRRHSIGAKRNLACEAARGQILMGWDDDDWYATHRISYQVAPLLAHEADVTGLDRGYLYTIPDGQCWACSPQLHARMFFEEVVGGTLAFRAHYWQHGLRFPDQSIAEDAAFLKALLERGARLTKLDNAGVFVYIRHGRNSWRFTEGRFLDRDGWRRSGPPAFMPPADLTFYQRLCRQTSAT